MPTQETPHLRNLWYLAAAGKDLKRGKMLARRVLGEPMVICRADDGSVFALRDLCPHRGIPLRHGSFDGREVACAYHGWRFGRDGRCSKIPALAEGAKTDPSKIRVPHYPCREVQGHVWVFIASSSTVDEDALPEVPRVPDIGEAPPQLSISQTFSCHADHAAYGLMDPAHPPFVHTYWWWQKGATSLRPKTKHFEPAPLGWRMKRHALPKENRVYHLLGKEVTNEITYSLPCVRIEHIKGDKHVACGMTTITPVDDKETVVTQALYWTVPWLNLLTPLGKVLGTMFLNQDRQMVLKQQDGMRDNPTLMLVDDFDTQSKWYLRLKKEWQRAEAEGRPFENPIKPKTLHWHS